MKHIFKKIQSKLTFYIVLSGLILVSATGTAMYAHLQIQSQAKEKNLQEKLQSISSNLDSSLKTIAVMKHEDQRVRNDQLQQEIQNIEKTYADSLTVYEQLQDLRARNAKMDDLEASYAKVLDLLSKKNFSSASAELVQLKIDVQKTLSSLNSSALDSQNITQSNTPPNSGYSRQQVKTEAGTFVIDIISADLNTSKVIVDTASDGTCTNDCPVLPLGDYAARSGAFAAINGPYFCPASYPSCAGKTNTFDTLMMNKNKVYFNSDNNVYSVVPAVIFMNGSARFVSRSLEWGRDTTVDSVIAAQPALVFNGNIVFTGDSELKRSGKGSRTFIGATGNMAYIGVVYDATTAEMAEVIHALGIQNALNLDSGGSVALWSNGRYVAGPGRNLPFGILFVHK